jgi:PadR family transcriptional regulator PadR
MRQVEPAGQGDGAARSFGRRQGWWRFTAPAVLVLLQEAPAHGYELMDRLSGVLPRQTRRPDAGTFYKFLRTLEAEGLVTSSWFAPESGPPRRVYSLTDAARTEFVWWSAEVERELVALEGLSVACRAAAQPAGPPPRR